MEILAQVHEKILVEWAKDKPEVVVFSGDLTGSTEITSFKNTYPERFYSMGLSEQNMVSLAGGMAREGYTPFLYTFAVFMYRRAYDQIAMSVAYPNQRVRFVGFLPGITTPGGVTHQAIEDIAVLRGLPNLTIVEMGDATEVETMLDVVQAIGGPVYIRMIRGAIPRLFDKSEPFQLDKVRVLSDGEDFTLFSSGICTEEAMRAAQALKERGISIKHVHVSTLKPFDDPAVSEAIKTAKHGVITLENHNVIGGLGTCVAERIAKENLGKKLYTLGIKDRFAYGSSKPYLMEQYNLDAMTVIRQVEDILGIDLKITKKDLSEVHMDAKEAIPTERLEAL